MTTTPVLECTCHPDDKPPVPCAQKYAYSECVAAAQETRRLCKDCRWMGPAGINARCLAPQNLLTLTSLVTGEPETVPHMEWCSIHRMHDTIPNRCGASGRWFEPRESEQTEAAQ